MQYHSSLVVKHLRGRTYDVFFDSGWENWTRVVVKKNEVILVKGQDIDANDKKNILEAINTLQ